MFLRWRNRSSCSMGYKGVNKMKSVLISIKPRWCELIANGKKTIEVRKTRPKIETPFKCYIYCTKQSDIFTNDAKLFLKKDECNGKVIGEFVCDKINEHPYTERGYKRHFSDRVLSCVPEKEINEYGKGKTLYGWHISDLVIYDEPKELSEFVKPCIYGEESERPCFTCEKSGYSASDMCIECFNEITRPPQSWCYVEE